MIQLMSECSAGIFIFTKDEKFLKEVDGDGPTEVYRPSENVVYELGAASVMWDRKIIIPREDGVNFPSDFSDLGTSHSMATRWPAKHLTC